MAEYIEREALIAEFKRLKLGENSLIEKLFADGVYAVLETFPATDVEPVRHGKWITATSRSSHSYGRYECSECHGIDNDCSDYYGTHSVKEQEWCPWCGARMDGGVDNG